MALLRVLDAMPLRLLNSWVGSIEIVRTAPGWYRDTNGWSSHPPGEIDAERDRALVAKGRRAAGRQAAVRQPPRARGYSMPSSRQSRALLSWAPSSLTTKTSGLIVAQLVDEVEQAHAAADPALLDAPERLDEVLPLVLRVDGIPPLQAVDALVVADRDVEVPVRRGLGEERHVRRCAGGRTCR